MTTIKAIILDEEFDEKLIETRNKISSDFRHGDYGPPETWGNQELIWFAINQFCSRMGFFDD